VGAKDLNAITKIFIIRVYNKYNSNIQYIGICRALLSEPDLLIKWKNCEDKTSQCVSCMNCYKFENQNEIECILNTKKKIWVKINKLVLRI